MALAEASAQVQMQAVNCAADSPSIDFHNKQTANTNFISSCQSSKFGWGRFTPDCLQRFCNAKWALFWLCWAGALQGFIVVGLVSVVLTTLEKRYGLRSAQTGFIVSGYDIACLVFLVPVSFVGGRSRSSKPFYMGLGTILMGIGSLVISLPHFLVGNYVGIPTDGVCSKREWNSSNSEFDSLSSVGSVFSNKNEKEDLSWTVWIFLLGQILIGIGASPIYTLGIAYIDENVSKKMSSVYLGISYTMTIIGPAMGFVVGGQLLNIYVDFLSVDSTEIEITNDNSAWIGAWWLGFVIAGIACLLVSIPMLAYPRVLPGTSQLMVNRDAEAYGDNIMPTGTSFDRIGDLPTALVLLMKNLTFVFISIAGACEMFLVTGFAAFLPKQFENLFNTTPMLAGLLVGIVSVPTGAVGTFLGGYLVKKFNLVCSQIIKLCIFFAAVSVIFIQGYILHCSIIEFAGVTVNYKPFNQINLKSKESMTFTSIQSPSTLSDGSLNAVCNLNCSCSRANYEPVCGSDNIAYFNPCYAGCKYVSYEQGSKIYTDCSCINDSNDHNSATNTTCATDCNLLIYFVVLTSLVLLFTFLNILPSLTATIRCVRSNQRSFALGIQWTIIRLLGTIPAPLLLGSIIDTTCILWGHYSDNENSTSNCLLYDNNGMSRMLWTIGLTVKFITTLMFSLSWIVYKPQA